MRFPALISILALLFLGLGSMSCHQAGRDVEEGKRFLKLPATVFTTTTLSGESWSLQEQRGKVIVLHFWASWCDPCLGKIPALRELEDEFGRRDDFLIVGIALDEDADSVRRAVTEYRIPGVQLFEAGKGMRNSVAQAYGVRSLPRAAIISKAGTSANLPSFRDSARLVAALLRTESSDYEKIGLEVPIQSGSAAH